jgi:hypothetical protein
MKQNQAPAAAAASALPANPTLDGHGHNLADYDWVPVRRKPRADGWSPEKQFNFIEAIADGASTYEAAARVGMSPSGAYKLRRQRGAEAFDRAWDAASTTGAKRLIDEAFERALVGSDEPIFNRDGVRVGRKFRRSDQMLMFLLRAYFPERFNIAAPARTPAASHRGTDMADDAVYLSPRAMASRAIPLPHASLPIADALDALLPEPPPDITTVLSEEEIAERLEIADLTGGEVPPWHRDRDLTAMAEPDPRAHLPAELAGHYDATLWNDGDKLAQTTTEQTTTDTPVPDDDNADDGTGKDNDEGCDDDFNEDDFYDDDDDDDDNDGNGAESETEVFVEIAGLLGVNVDDLKSRFEQRYDSAEDQDADDDEDDPALPPGLTTEDAMLLANVDQRMNDDPVTGRAFAMEQLSTLDPYSLVAICVARAIQLAGRGGRL